MPGIAVFSMVNKPGILHPARLPYRWFLSLLTGAILLLAIQAHGQRQKLDSMKQRWQAEKNDSLRLGYQLDYGAQLVYVDSAEAHRLFEDAFKVANEKGYADHAASAKLEEGILYYLRGNYIRSITTNETAERLFAPLPENDWKVRSLAAVYNNQGALYSLINELEKAQQYYMRAVDLYGKIPDSGGLVVTWFNVAFLYIDIQDWQQAAKFLQRSIDCFDGRNKANNYIESMARKAAMHFRTGEVAAGKALLQLANNMRAKYPSLLTDIYCFNADGEYAAATGNWASALQAHRKAYATAIAYEDPYYEVDEAWELGRSFLGIGQKDSALNYLQKALAQARQYKYLPKVKFILKDLASYYASTGKYKQAFALSQNLNAFSDSLVALQNHNRLLLNEARYQAREKEGKISALEKTTARQSATIRQQNIWNYLLTAAAIALGLILFLSYRTYKQKQQLHQQRISQLETEKQLLAAASLIAGEEKERSRLAKDLHDGLGGLLSGIKFSFQHMKENLVLTPENQLAFERSMDMLDSSIRELRSVAHNMMPEALVKFGLDAALRDFYNSVNESGAHTISYQSFQLDEPAISQQMATGIYRIVQELVNNAIKHANAKQVLVQLSQQGRQLTITVEDDGTGFDTSTLKQKGGMGWSNIYSRVNYLQGKVDIRSGPGEGTSVYIEMNT
jgi:signal transduction histidine kinase